MTIFGDFLKYSENLDFFTVALYSGLMVHSKYVFWYLGRLAMKINLWGSGEGSLIQEFSDQTKAA